LTAAETLRNSPGSARRFVLVVDSEPRSLIFTSMMVQRFGYHACSAPGAGTAHEIAMATPPALVIAELRLKGLGGLDLLDLLRQHATTASVPVVIMARELTPEVAEQCRTAGASAVLEKPLKANALYRAIHPLLEPGSRRRHVRIETKLPVTVNDRPLDCVDGESVANLSVNGMYLRTRQAYAEGSRVMVQITLHEEQIATESRVVHCRPNEGGSPGMWGVGLQFLAAPPEAAEIIRRFIHDEVTHGMDTVWED
jgi:CheY-like chemotaxis protein/Tfp pilus assembly protein PilZ